MSRVCHKTAGGSGPILPFTFRKTTHPVLVPGVLLCALQHFQLSWRSPFQENLARINGGFVGTYMKNSMLRLIALILAITASLVVFTDHSKARRETPPDSSFQTTAAAVQEKTVEQ